MASVSPARKQAFAILLQVELGRGHSDDLLRGNAVSALSEPDRNLATALVLGVLRWQIVLDQRIRPLLKRPDAKLDVEDLIALRMGAFQLLYMDRIPAHAAIGESVELVKKAGHRFASGMVNAVLRKIGAAGDRVAEEDVDAADHGYPDWIVSRWKSHFGEAAACAMCRYGQSQPSLTLRIPDPETELEFAKAGVVLGRGELLTSARVVLSGEIAATAALREGRVRIQDEASQLVAEIAGKGSSILDCCAAPGGKTFILAERNPKAKIVACEVSPQRLAALSKRLALFGDRIDFRLADATQLTAEDEFDLVLADVPCSGTGTLGRNPEIRHRLKEDDLAIQAKRQRDLLSAAFRAVRSGGRVVYSTCSMEPEENEDVVNDVLRVRKDTRVVSLRSRLNELRDEGIVTADGAERLKGCVTPGGFLRLLTGAFGTDGFFVAMMERMSGSVR
jgi:16S rRNA (cytosine967-C5)-methyltransferase